MQFRPPRRTWLQPPRRPKQKPPFPGALSVSKKYKIRRRRRAHRAPRQAVCLETQFFPDSPNHPEWGDILLRPGKRYDYTTEYRFGVRQEG